MPARPPIPPGRRPTSGETARSQGLHDADHPGHGGSCAVLVLTGGGSTRMGSRKDVLPVGGTVKRTLLCETARYWASRCEVDDRGVHLCDVVGPDEYHEHVDDNAFTNVMARWNLRVAAGEATAEVDPEEVARWRSLADALVDGYDVQTGRHEQFTGYSDLEPAFAADVARPPYAADLLLGREGVAATQLVKQPDVLMLHHLVPDELPAGSFERDLDHYLPRTTHGSSLSPPIAASLLARAGRFEEALRWLRTAVRIDFDDLSGTTAAGLHLATIGGAWQAMVTGMLGADVRGGVVHLDPRLPESWSGFELRFLCLGAQLHCSCAATASWSPLTRR